MTGSATGANAVRVSGLSQPEGPVALADGSLAVVEMGEERESVAICSPDGSRTIHRQKDGRPTGLAVDGDGYFWLAGGAGNSLVRLTPEGEVVLNVRGDDDGPFLFPNDLAFGPDGMLYMTDSGMPPREFITGFAIRPDFRTARYDGRVYRIDPRTGRVIGQIASGLRFANGIAFDAKGTLYFNETLTGVIYAKEDGREPTPFANVRKPFPGDPFRGPDGMAFDEAGTLYCAVYGQREVALISPAGRLLPPLRTNGDRPTNVAFSLTERLIFVTEVQFGSVEVIVTGTSGLALHAPCLST